MPEADGVAEKLLGCVLQLQLESAGDDDSAAGATGFGMMLSFFRPPVASLCEGVWHPSIFSRRLGCVTAFERVERIPLPCVLDWRVLA